MLRGLENIPMGTKLQEKICEVNLYDWTPPIGRDLSLYKVNHGGFFQNI